MKTVTSARQLLTILAYLSAIVLLSLALSAVVATPDISVHMASAGQSVDRAKTATFAVSLTATNGFAGSVTLSATGLPSGSTASFAPDARTLTATGRNSTAASVLSVTTTSSTPIGSYTVTVTGTSGKVNDSVTAGLTVNDPRSGSIGTSGTSTGTSGTSGSTFTISGNLAGLLAPGKSFPLELSLSNPNKRPLSVTSLSVTLQKLTRTAFAISRNQPCSTNDYAVTQYAGRYPLVVPGSSTRTLAQLGVASGQWPQIRFVDRPVNQDGCKGSTLTLSYAGSGQLN